MQDLLVTESGWRKRLYARLLALNIVEFFEDIAELLGKTFRDKVAALGDKSANSDRLDSIRKQLNQLRVKHEKDLRSIRNIAIGHRDKNSKAQVELINNLDIIGLESLAEDMMNWLSSLRNFLTDMIEKMTEELIRH